MIRHRYHRELYQNARWEASYYAWCARKAFPLPGNNPLTGRPRHKGGPFERGEGRAAYKALARYWLGIARQIRTNN